jgi:hypothetical protein
MLYKFITKTIILAFLIIPNAYAQSEMANNLSQAIKEIMVSKDKITKKDYDNFWRKTGVKSREEKINFILTVKNSFLLIQEYNKAVWECAERSWITNKEIECKDLQKISENIKVKFNNSIDIEKFKEMESGFNVMIKQSSKRSNEVNSGGNKMPQNITLESIQNLKKETSRMLDRTNLIFQLDFVDNQSNY